MSHQCPAPDCTVDVPSHQFACRADWYRLPKPYRDAVWAGYRRGALSDEHCEAMHAAHLWYLDNAAPVSKAAQ